MLKIVDQWTTRDGEWFPSNKKYSITEKYAERYGHEIEAKGAAHHIFVRAPRVIASATFVGFGTLDGNNWVEHPVIGWSWVSHPIFQSYDPATEEGAWHVWIDGERVTEYGIGLPHGWHVSTFLVVEDVAPELPPPVVPTQDRWQIYRNGVLVHDSEG